MDLSSENRKTTLQLIEENQSLRTRIAELEAALASGERPAGVPSSNKSSQRDSARLAQAAIQSLHEADERFHTCLDHMLDCFAIFSSIRDSTGRIVDFRYDYINQAGCRNNGLPLEQHIGRTLLDLLPNHQKCSLFDDYCRVVETGESLEREAIAYEDCFGTQDPSTRIFDVRAWKLDDGFAVVWRNITARKEAQRQLQESERRFRKVFEDGGLGMAIVGLDHRFQSANARLCQMLGYSEPELQARTFEQITHPDNVAMDTQQIQRLLRGEISSYAVEKRYFRKDGQVIWANLTGSMIHDAAGRPLSFLATIEDITARKQAELALRDSGEISRTTLAALPTHIAVIDRHGRIVAVNQAWIDFACNNSITELSTVTVGASYLDACRRAAATGDADATRALVGIEAVLRGELPQFALEYPCHSQQEERWFLMTAVPLISEGEGGVIVTHQNITQRKQADESLRQSELRLQLSQSIAHVGSWELDLITNQLTWSDEVYRIFGLQPQAFGTSYEVFIEQVHPEDRAAVNAAYSSSVREGRDTYELTHRIIRKDTGEIRTVHEKCQHQRDDTGRIVRSIGMVQDITDRVLAEEALRQSEHQLQLFVEHAPAALAMFDRQMRYVSASRRWLTDYGLKERDLRGRSHYELFPEVPESWREVHRRALAGEVLCSEEDPFHRADGTVQWLRWEVHPWYDSAGSVAGIVIFSEDITRRRAVEQALRDERSKLQGVFEVLEVGVMVSSASGQMLSINPVALKLHDYTSLADVPTTPQGFVERFELRYLDGRLVPDDQRPAPRSLRGEQFRDFELQVLNRRTGRTWIGSWSVLPIRNSQGEVQLLVFTVQDITQRQRAARELEQAKAAAEAASQAKDQFIAVLSHELRTPLTPVVASLAMLQDDSRFDDDTRESLEVIRRNVELEARLIDDLLDVTRIEKGKVELDRRPIDLAIVIRRALEVCMPDILSRKLDLSVHVPADLYTVHADAARLQQVFWNLLKNAIKFTPKDGRLQIRCWRGEADQVIAEVQDSGEGIDPQVLPRLFNAFEQGGRQTTRQFGGLGLGLAICKALVELHGGTLTAYSAGKGTGATFTVRLPLLMETVASCSPAAAVPSPSAVPVAPVRILLVEDHRDTARVMRRLLSAAGHEVQIAPDLATAIELSSQQPFDLLVSDLGLPDGSGLDLMRAIRARGQTLPGIALSGYGQEQDVLQSRDAGFAVHLVKPVTPTKLKEAIAQVIRHT